MLDETVVKETLDGQEEGEVCSEYSLESDGDEGLVMG